VPLLLVGEIAPGGLLAQEHTTVTVEAEATHLPSEIEISIEGMQVGSHVTANDLELAAGTTLITDPETLLIAVGSAPTAEEMEAETAEAAEELGIVQDKPADEVEAERATEQE
jgi:large subunit ribosomal protein L25